MARIVSLSDVHDSIGEEYYFNGAEAVEASYGGRPVEIATHRAHEANLQRLTICILVLKNGTIVTGQSICQDPSQYSQEIGERWAREQALGKIFELLVHEARSTEHYISNLPNGLYKMSAARDGAVQNKGFDGGQVPIYEPRPSQESLATAVIPFVRR